MLHEYEALLGCTLQIKELKLRVLLDELALVIQHRQVVIAVGVVFRCAAYQVVYAKFRILLWVDAFDGHDAEVEVTGRYATIDRAEQVAVRLLQVSPHLLLGFTILLLLRLDAEVLVQIATISEQRLAIALMSKLTNRLIYLD